MGKVRTAITASSVLQTAIATGSFASGGASGNMDLTPASTANIFVGTPGSGASQNQYTAPHAFLLTASAATSLTIASQSIGLAISVGDCIFTFGTGAAPLPLGLNNTLYIGVTTQAVSGATQANVLTGEPTLGTGGYQRIVVPNVVGNWTAATAAQPSVKASAVALSFVQSTAAWSTTSTNLAQAFVCDNPTGILTSTVNVLAYGALATPQAVNAGSITLQFSSAGFTVTVT